jgi:hypothetical protein
MLKRFLAFTANAALSACIGSLVGLLLITLPVSPIESKACLLFTSTGIGLIIGVASRFSSCIVYQYGLESPLWSYALTFVITLTGCTAASPFFDPSFSKLLLSIIIAEPLALMTAYINMRYAARLNDSLKRKQAKLKQQSK